MSRVPCLIAQPRHTALLVFGLALAGPALAVAQPAAPTAGEKTVTVEGCLTRDASKDLTSAAELYVLTLPLSGTAASARGAAAPGGAVPAPALPTMYALRTTDEHPVTLPPLVSHRVRVTGTSTAASTTSPLAGRSSEATPFPAAVGTGSAGSGPTGTPFDRANLPTLLVRTITSLADTCKAGS